MREIAGFNASLKLEDGVVGRVPIAYQRARPILQEGNRIFRPSAQAEVVHHARQHIEAAARIPLLSLTARPWS